MKRCGCTDPVVFGHDCCYTTIRLCIETVHRYCQCATCPCTCHAPP